MEIILYLCTRNYNAAVVTGGCGKRGSSKGKKDTGEQDNKFLKKKGLELCQYFTLSDRRTIRKA